MQSSFRILLKNQIRAHSGINVLKYEKDKKKRNKVIGGYVGMAVLYIMLFAFCLVITLGMGAFNMTQVIPYLNALLIALMEFIFTLLKTNGYMFAFKEYDMLMALPFEINDVVKAKFLQMYRDNLPVVLVGSIPLVLGYGICEKPGALVYIIYIALIFFLPIIPMALATLVGTLVAGVGAKFRHKNIVTTILTFIFVIFCFSLRFIIEGIFRNNQVEDIITKTSDITMAGAGYYFPALWFGDAVCKKSISGILLMIGVSVLLFELTFILISTKYRSINSRLMSGIGRKKYKMTSQKVRSVEKSIAFKEFKRFTGSTNYLVNAGMGLVLALIAALIALFVDVNSVFKMIAPGSTASVHALAAGVPFIMHMILAMEVTTCMSYSLEGKNVWIVDSLPISRKQLFDGKILFQLILMCPVSILCNLVFGIKCGCSLLDVISMIACGLALCLYSTLHGMMCDIKHVKLEWDNEIEVIKQGSAVAFYMFPAIFFNIFMFIVLVFLGNAFPIPMLLGIITVLVLLFSYLRYRRIQRRINK